MSVNGFKSVCRPSQGSVRLIESIVTVKWLKNGRDQHQVSILVWGSVEKELTVKILKGIRECKKIYSKQCNTKILNTIIMLFSPAKMSKYLESRFTFRKINTGLTSLRNFVWIFRNLGTSCPTAFCSEVFKTEKSDNILALLEQRMRHSCFNEVKLKY